VLSNSARAIGTGGGGDVNATDLNQLLGSVGEVKSWNDVVAIGGDILSGEANEGHIIPRENTGTFHLEGWKIVCTGPADAITVRWRQPILQIQNCYIEVTTAGTSHHSDGFQTQEAILGELRFDRDTIKTDYQGIFLSNEPQNQGPAPSKVDRQIISRVLFLPGTHGAPQTYFFKAFPPRPGAAEIGPTEMYDVWMPASFAVSKVYPQWNSWDGGDVGDYYGGFVTTKVHPVLGTQPFLRFSVAGDTVPIGSKAGQPARDCGVRGDGGIWLYNVVGDAADDVGCDTPGGTGPGITANYVSPGYQ
jgi:hypothetical protein